MQKTKFCAVPTIPDDGGNRERTTNRSLQGRVQRRLLSVLPNRQSLTECRQLLVESLTLDYSGQEPRPAQQTEICKVTRVAVDKLDFNRSQDPFTLQYPRDSNIGDRACWDRREFSRNTATSEKLNGRCVNHDGPIADCSHTSIFPTERTGKPADLWHQFRVNVDLCHERSGVFPM